MFGSLEKVSGRDGTALPSVTRCFSSPGGPIRVAGVLKRANTTDSHRRSRPCGRRQGRGWKMRSLRADERMPDNGVWPRRCRTTRLSMVRAAAAGGAAAEAAHAELYRAYFYPVYALIAARRGREAAEELTQSFFVERLLDSQDLARFDPTKCRKFRNWLFTAVDSFLKNEWKARRRKCRDVRRTLALDFEAAEIRFLNEPTADPESRYNRAWALCVLSNVITRVRGEFCESVPRADRARAEIRFDALKIFLP